MERHATNESPAQFCMICLDVHSKLLQRNKYNLDVEYEHLTGISLAGTINFTPMFCSECAQRLVNCCKLRDKSQRAFQLLAELLSNNAALSLQTLSSVDRARCQLTSSVVKKTFEPDHCDLYVTEDTGSVDKVYVKNEENDLPLEIKTEIPKMTDDIDALEFFNVDTCDRIEGIDDPSNDEDNIGDLKQRKTSLIEALVINDHDRLRNDDIDGLSDDIVADNDIQFDTNSLNEIDKHTKLLNTKNIKGSLNTKDNKTKNNKDVSKKKNKVSKLKLVSEAKCNLKSKVKKSKDKVKLKDVESFECKNSCIEKISSEENEAVTEVKKKRGRPKKIRPPPEPKVPKDYEELKEFKIIERTPEEQLADLRARQETDTYKRSQYQCTDCYKGFQDENAYNTHMERHTDKYGVHACPVCRVRVKRRLRVNHHVINIHKFLFHCRNCTFVTNHKKSALDHSRWHNGKKYKCTHCEKEFDKRTSYFNHLRTKHPSDHVCTLCGFSFIGERGLMSHINKKHYADDKQELSGPQCAECDIRFAHHTAYQIHLNVSPKHAAPDELRTNDAHKVRSFLPNEKRRERGQRGGDKKCIVDCELCGAVLESRRKYYWHFRNCHPHASPAKMPRGPKPRARFMCDQCGKVFQSQFHLGEHMATHSGETPEQCSACSKRFRSAASLRKHVERAHLRRQCAERRPGDAYRCAHCAYRTGDKGNLNRHVQTHLELNARKLHYCAACGKTFTTRMSMKNHTLHVHQKVPWPARVRAARGRSVPRANNTDSSES